MRVKAVLAFDPASITHDPVELSEEQLAMTLNSGYTPWAGIRASIGKSEVTENGHTTTSTNKDKLGFVAALDQSGGSTPKALSSYGIKQDAWSRCLRS
jgi:hypothetical protein